MEDAATTKARLHPFYGRVLVAASLVDSEQHDSGLIVPWQYEGDDEVRRGVVIESAYDGPSLSPGTVVYYRGGIRVLDVVALEPHEILAYQEDE